jgi:hypothetical protein
MGQMTECLLTEIRTNQSKTRPQENDGKAGSQA